MKKYVKDQQEFLNENLNSSKSGVIEQDIDKFIKIIKDLHPRDSDKIIETFDQIQSTDLEELALTQPYNPYLYIALCITSPLKNGLIEKIKKEGEDTGNMKQTETGLNGTFILDGTMYEMIGLTLKTNLKKKMEKGGMTRTTKTDRRSGKQVNQYDYYDKISSSKKSKELNFISDEKEIRKIFDL